MPHLSRKDVSPWIRMVSGCLGFPVLLILLNCMLLMAFSYSINALAYNMTTGCLFSEPLCDDNETLAIYRGSSLDHLIGWSSLLMMIEMAILLLLLAIGLFIAHYYARYRVDRSLDIIRSLPEVRDAHNHSIS